MLLACFLWANIVKEEDILLEPSMQANKRSRRAYTAVPPAHLGLCIIYFSHMLRWTEWMGIAEYPHLFRFAAKAAESDLFHACLTVDCECLDQEMVIQLLKQTRSTV